MARRTAVAIVFDDGTETLIPVRPISLVAAERNFKGNIPPIEGTLWAAWHSAKKPMGNFDAWLSKVDAMDEIDPDEETTTDMSTGTAAAPAAGGADSPEAPPAE